MNVEKISDLLIKSGLSGIGIAFVWWLICWFGFVFKSGGATGYDFVCLLYTTANCFMAKTVGWIAGYPMYDPLLLWASTVVFVLGIILMNLSGTSADSSHGSYQHQIVKKAHTYDREKWNTLLKYDDEIATAALRLEKYGQYWVDELAASYLSLNDKSYLGKIVEKLELAAKSDTRG